MCRREPLTEVGFLAEKLEDILVERLIGIVVKLDDETP
jgi:hypothetical protein